MALSAQSGPTAPLYIRPAFQGLSTPGDAKRYDVDWANLKSIEGEAVVHGSNFDRLVGVPSLSVHDSLIVPASQHPYRFERGHGTSIRMLSG